MSSDQSAEARLREALEKIVASAGQSIISRAHWQNIEIAKDALAVMPDKPCTCVRMEFEGHRAGCPAAPDKPSRHRESHVPFREYQIAWQAATKISDLAFIEPMPSAFPVQQAMEIILAAIQAARAATPDKPSASIFTGLRAVVDVLKRQKEAKQNVAVEWNDGWNDGYGAAMEDAIKSIESFMEEINGKPMRLGAEQ